MLHVAGMFAFSFRSTTKLANKTSFLPLGKEAFSFAFKQRFHPQKSSKCPLPSWLIVGDYRALTSNGGGGTQQHDNIRTAQDLATHFFSEHKRRLNFMVKSFPHKKGHVHQTLGQLLLTCVQQRRGSFPGSPLLWWAVRPSVPALRSISTISQIQRRGSSSFALPRPPPLLCTMTLCPSCLSMLQAWPLLL